MPHLKNLDYWSYQDRMFVVSAYDGWIRSQMEIKRLEFYCVNFMFNRLPGRRPARIEQMKSEVTRFHSILSRHVVRKRSAWMWKFLIPQLFGVPDLKAARQLDRPRRRSCKYFR